MHWLNLQVTEIFNTLYLYFTEEKQRDAFLTRICFFKDEGKKT